MAAEQAAGWVKILADDYAATVSTRALLAQADSHLAQVIEPNPGRVRWCSSTREWVLP
jgi:hypothetical protein